MKRRAYPYARYLIRNRSQEEVGPELESFMVELGFHIDTYDDINEEVGTLIIAVNKQKMDIFKALRIPGKLAMILTGQTIDTR